MNGLSSRKRAVEGIRAAMIEKCGETLKRLSGRTISAKDIHAARKALKKARAWLRLLKTGVGTRAFREHNHMLRDAARPLSASRDARILIETLEKLLKRHHEPATDRRFGRFENALQRDRHALQHRLQTSRGGLAASRRLLRRSKVSLPRLRIHGKDWNVIGRSFQKVYARGLQNLCVARDKPTPESLHEWRKDVKALWHEFQMLEPLWPGVMGEWADQTHQLADYLGDDHDLWLLREAAKGKNETLSQKADFDALLALIDRRRNQLQEKAFLLGTRLYEPKPRRLRARLGKYWRLWCEAGCPSS